MVTPYQPETPQPNDLTEPLLEICKKPGPYSYEELSDLLNVGIGRVRTAVAELKQQGYGFNLADNGDVVRTRTITPRVTAADHRQYFDGEHLKFGLISDNHTGSEKERPDIVDAVYDVFQHEGVRQVYHCGDITDGQHVYRGQENEIRIFGTDKQVDEVVDGYPKRRGIRTRFITGNHDLREYEHGGADPGGAIANQRKDMEYLGQMQATVQLADGVDMEMLHPQGGQAYALSYKLQRNIDNRPPESRPSILAAGHYHTMFYMEHGGVHCFQVPSTKDRGIFEARHGLQGNKGAWMVEMTVRDGEIVRMKPEALIVNEVKNKIEIE
jgi:predicted phosphodiesterase